MPRYFFDFDDGDGPTRDVEGTELPDLAAAQSEATETMVQIAKDTFGQADAGALRISIRGEDDAVMLRLALDFSTTAPG